MRGCFIRVSKHEETGESKRSKAKCFCTFFVVFLLNWFLKRVYFIISKIKTTTEKTSCIYLFFAFYYSIITCAYLLVSVMKCVFLFFSQSKFHINYARKLDHFPSDRHPWHLAENYA